MATLQTSPLLLRSSAPAERESQSAFAPDPRPYLVSGPLRKIAKSTQSYHVLFPHESEDARLTGSTRSLYRRLLALNLPGKIASAAVSPVTAAEASKPIYSGFRIA